MKVQSTTYPSNHWNQGNTLANNVAGMGEHSSHGLKIGASLFAPSPRANTHSNDIVLGPTKLSGAEKAVKSRRRRSRQEPIALTRRNSPAFSFQLLLAQTVDYREPP